MQNDQNHSTIHSMARRLCWNWPLTQKFRLLINSNDKSDPTVGNIKKKVIKPFRLPFWLRWADHTKKIQVSFPIGPTCVCARFCSIWYRLVRVIPEKSISDNHSICGRPLHKLPHICLIIIIKWLNTPTDNSNKIIIKLKIVIVIIPTVTAVINNSQIKQNVLKRDLTLVCNIHEKCPRKWGQQG